MLSLLIGVAIVIVALRIAPALAHRLAGRRADDGDIKRQLDALERRLTEAEERFRMLSEGTDRRFTDLEERVDFSERVLQEQRSRRQLPRSE